MQNVVYNGGDNDDDDIVNMNSKLFEMVLLLSLFRCRN